MEALICPECGGKFDPPAAGSEYAKCVYCETSFRIDRPVPLYQPDRSAVDREKVFVSHTQSASARSTGIVFITVIVVAVVTFAALKMLSVRTQTDQTVNTALQAANNAQSAANALRKAAEDMANQASQIPTNIKFPTPTPNKPTHAR